MWRPFQEGQTPRPLQENATTNAWLPPGQRHDQHRLQWHLVAEIRRRSGVLERMIREGRLGIAGMVYDVGSGTTQIVPNTLAGLPPGVAAPLPAQG